MSITDELRKYASECTPNARERLTSIADRIDAEHEAKVAYWQEASYKDGYDEGFAGADDWLGQHEDAMAEHGWIRLPVDADGEVWHVGDLAVGKVNPNNPKAVERMLWYGPDLGWEIETDTIIFPCTERARHHQPPTVEDVLREFTDAIFEWAGQSGTVAETGTWTDVAAEYVARLQLRKADE